MSAPHKDGDALPEGERPACIPPGDYRVRFDRYETSILFGRAAKIRLHFTVIEPGPYFDTARLSLFYNASRLLGKPGVNGKFKVGWKSQFLRDFCRLFATSARFDKIVQRLDRFPMSLYREHIFLARVRTVTTGADQKPIPEPLQYSVISELLGVVEP